MLLSKQDVKLHEAIALYSGKGVRRGVDWGKVSSHMGGTRSSKQCQIRWHDTLKLTDSGLIKEGAWAEDEVSVTHATIVHVLYCLCNIYIALCSCI
jgi:hypothetical protein